MNRKHMRAFTLIEILLYLSLITFLGTLCAFQSVSSFLMTMAHLEDGQKKLDELVHEGKVYRHVFEYTDEL